MPPATARPFIQLGSGIYRLGRLVRFSHTIFALPFAVSGVLYAVHSRGAWPEAVTWLWVLMAMVGARTAAMAFNRFTDRRFDALNPRTQEREIPRGEVSPRQALGLTVVGALVLVWAAAHLNPLCLRLSPVALAVILGYSVTKRFTWASHFVLGLGLGVAPLGAWLAVMGEFHGGVVALAGGVLFWMAGMDILYALQDEAFDRETGLYSVPQRFGRSKALIVSLICHLLCIICLGITGLLMNVSVFYAAGLALCAGVLAAEQIMVRSTHPKRIQIAFFDLNGLFSLVHLGAVALGVFL